MKDLKYCLITGASRGIGRDLAREFARNGYALILVARDKVALTVLKDELHAYTPDIKLFQCDLTCEESLVQLVSNIKQQQLQIEILINNAGIGMCDDFVNISPEILTQMINLNITAATLLTRHLLPDMLRRRTGRICNVASTAAFLPGPLMAVYYASKAYILSFSEALSVEIGRQGISVSVLCPGPTNTDFSQASKTGNTRLIKNFNQMSSFQVARIAYRGILKGKRVIIPGLINKILILFIKFLPDVVLMRIIKFLNTNSKPKNK